MTGVWLEQIAVTVDAAGAGTAESGPVSGYVAEVRYGGTAFGSTADFTLTRLGGQGGTVLALTDAQGPWQHAPLEQAYTVTGGSVTYDGTRPVYRPIPVDGILRLVVAEAAALSSGTIDVYVGGMA